MSGGTYSGATCCVVGGGPAGMMLGFLLARSGVPVTVVEKHADFFRDFRGDTIHPSTLELVHELGLLEEFLKIPHQELGKLKICVDGELFDGPDFGALPTHCKYIALMPQWDFLNFLAEKAKRYPTFTLRMNTEVTDLIEEKGRVVGVKARTAEGATEIRADFVFGTDGRSSTVRARAGLPVKDYGVPIDVLWYRISKSANQDDPTLGRIQNGRLMVTIDRGEYFQCAFLIPKGGFDAIKTKGLEAFRQSIADCAPFLSDRVAEIDDWDKVKLLTVQVNRLERWARPGLLCLGDAAHAMSPAGGVGINLAVQDAVCTANLLADKLRCGQAGLDDLLEVQRRRTWPVQVIQTIQIFIHRRMFGDKRHPQRAITIGKPAGRFLGIVATPLRYLGAYLVGVGVRPEHIETPEIQSP